MVCDVKTQNLVIELLYHNDYIYVEVMHQFADEDAL